jgi:organic radical activating enzyme
MSLVISEVFGPTVQGEGPSAGRRCGFVRLGLCNLDCAWCDTPYTWDWTRYDRKAETSRWDTGEIVRALTAMNVRLVVITGGEPLAQPRAAELVEACSLSGWLVEIETNGTRAAQGAAREARFNVSPKLSNSGVTRARAIYPEVLADFAAMDGTAFKFVCAGPEDLAEVDALVTMAGIDPSQVWLMPEGRDPDAVVSGLAKLADPAIERGYNLTGRLHVLAWGDRRAK